MAQATRILHVFPGTSRGGIKTWLVNILRNIDRSEFQFDFLVFKSDEQGWDSYEDEIRSLGTQIYRCTHPLRNPFAHVRDLHDHIARQGPFDMVHAHGYENLGAPLRAAAKVGVPVRIAHSHNAPMGAHWLLETNVLGMITKHWALKHMTHGIGCTRAACAAMFGPQWETLPNCRVVYNGIGWDAFHDEVDVFAVRDALSIPQDALVVGHVGRFEHQKNHALWFRVAEQIASQRPDAYFLLVGDGALRASFERQTQQLPFADRFRFTGIRADVPSLLQAMDVFLFPSSYEGFGIALAEAQAVGLPCVASDRITIEAAVVPHLVRYMSLNTPPAVWAQAALAMASDHPRAAEHAAAWRAVADSTFSIARSVEALTAFYRDIAAQRALAQRTLAAA